MAYGEQDLTKEVNDIKVMVVETNTTVRHIRDRLDKNEETAKGIYALSSTVEKLAQTIDNLSMNTEKEINNFRDSIKRMGERLEKLESAPAHNWKTLTTQILGIVVAAAAGYIFSNLTH